MRTCGVAGHQLVGDGDGQGHQFRGLVDGEAEHHALVARALGFVALRAGIHADGDVRGLLLERDQDAGRVAVEAVLDFGVAGVVDGLADDIGDFDIALGGDLAGDDGQAARQQGLDGDAAFDVLAQQFVEDGVADLVGELVGVALGDGLGGKQFDVGHGVVASFSRVVKDSEQRRGYQEV